MPPAAYGLGSILIGLVLLIWPEGTARFAFFLLGALSLITGLGSLVDMAAHAGVGPGARDHTQRRTGGLACRRLADLLARLGPGRTGLGDTRWSRWVAAAVMFWLTARFKGPRTTRIKTRVIKSALRGRRGESAHAPRRERQPPRDAPRTG